ncbi:hypothetical protein SLUN_11830 [Streptomyces lunaelactis]|uniref:Uncharacterized protein n=1 Tax=Streptomyces lunaelactis TaxID=1535768 RepID=A0A2R4T0V9_9ACTN|nr:hypothetical protein [Streptomyces lunaelactis]AVZ72775.1 hypothetical protein SLUN_11830 [Streptomyces lunaelactis]NUK89302.1 hypothetical protein [Streptomyces lunaelactis]
MTPHNELRLLPWSGQDGKPCFLSTDDAAGYLSRLADNTESVQLGLGSELLDHAHEVLAGRHADPEQLHLLAANLTNALQDAIRVATSRGHRLPHTTLGTDEEHPEAPRPAAPHQ